MGISRHHLVLCLGKKLINTKLKGRPGLSWGFTAEVRVFQTFDHRFCLEH